MRVVGGSFGGTILRAPKAAHVRPTSARTREALFSILQSEVGGALADLRVLDLFGGTGALGLEALSRGAAFALFIDNAASARGFIRANAEACGVQGRVKIYRRDATRLGARPAALPAFDLVFADPPYGRGLAEAALAALMQGDWLAANARLVVEEAKRSQFVAPDGFAQTTRRTYGDTELIFLQFDGAKNEGEGER